MLRSGHQYCYLLNAARECSVIPFPLCARETSRCGVLQSLLPWSFLFPPLPLTPSRFLRGPPLRCKPGRLNRKESFLLSARRTMVLRSIQTIPRLTRSYPCPYRMTPVKCLPLRNPPWESCIIRIPMKSGYLHWGILPSFSKNSPKAVATLGPMEDRVSKNWKAKARFPP